MNDITKYQPELVKQFSLTPRNLEEAMKFSELIADSDIVPPALKGKPGNILVTIALGGEIGISLMGSIQNIAVINGMPSVWGDTALGLVTKSSGFESINEHIETGDEERTGGVEAVCTIKRKGQDPHTVRFSKNDAIRADLWTKQGPWTKYPKRMLQMRARSWALRDKFADVLKGIGIREEAEDVEVTWTDPEPIKEPEERAGRVASDNEEMAMDHLKSVADEAESHLPDAKDLLPPEEQAHMDELAKPYVDPDTGDVVPDNLEEEPNGNV